MRLTSKGQITVPIRIRRRLGLGPTTELAWDVAGGEARLRRADGRQRGGDLIAKLRGRGDVKLTTDQIMRMTRG